jgi:hypothetical protein
MDLSLVCDCLAPLAIYRALRNAGVPSERRPMHRQPSGLERDSDPDPLDGCGADFVILVDGRGLAGLRRLRPEDALQGTLHCRDMVDGGLLRQLVLLRRFPLPLLVLEGTLSQKHRLSEEAICSLQYWCFRNHLFILHTPDMRGTATMVEMLFWKIQLSLHELEKAKKALAAGRI